MKSQQEELKKTIRQLGDLVNNKELVDQVTNAFGAVLQSGKLPKEALKLTDEKIELYYAQAFRLYNSGKYMEASCIFRMLIFLDVTQPRYAMGLAACAHMMKDYDAAIKLYTMCSVLDSKDPLAPFHASDCYIQKNDPASAMMLLEMAVLRAGKRPEFQILKDRALLTMASLKKEIAQSIPT